MGVRSQISLRPQGVDLAQPNRRLASGRLALIQWVDREKISIFWIYKLKLKEGFFAFSASREPKMEVRACDEAIY